MVHFGNDWDDILRGEFEKEYYLKIREFLKREYSERVIFPNMHDIFNAMKLTAYSDVKAVIIGQDPYHGPGQAHGLAFSVKEGIRHPPSLQNIFKEIYSDIGTPPPESGELTRWAKQGVLLLNATLTVREGEANSHSRIGWQIFTDRVIELLSEREKPICFMLWGSFAQAKAELIDESRHKIFTAPHPSPLSASRGFFGCRHFSKVNRELILAGDAPIIW